MTEEEKSEKFNSLKMQISRLPAGTHYHNMVTLLLRDADKELGTVFANRLIAELKLPFEKKRTEKDYFNS